MNKIGFVKRVLAIAPETLELKVVAQACMQVMERYPQYVETNEAGGSVITDPDFMTRQALDVLGFYATYTPGEVIRAIQNEIETGEPDLAQRIFHKLNYMGVVFRGANLQ